MDCSLKDLCSRIANFAQFLAQKWIREDCQNCHFYIDEIYRSVESFAFFPKTVLTHPNCFTTKLIFLHSKNHIFKRSLSEQRFKKWLFSLIIIPIILAKRVLFLNIFLMRLHESQWGSIRLNESEWVWLSLNESDWVWMSLIESEWVWTSLKSDIKD